jgi:hypothetical protein
MHMEAYLFRQILMKPMPALLCLALFAIGCSKQQNISPPSEPAVIAQDLGKDINYFLGLYGQTSSQKSVNQFDFSLPSVGHLINLAGPFTMQQFSSGKLGVVVVYREGTAQAIWVKYSLPNPWTDDQIKAALGAYDKKWSSVTLNSGVSIVGEAFMRTMMPALSPATFQSNSGILAYKTMANELMIYSPVLFHELNQKIADEEQQKRAVPKF